MWESNSIRNYITITEEQTHNTTMSSFTNYETKAASEYDIVRLPVGHEVS